MRNYIVGVILLLSCFILVVVSITCDYVQHINNKLDRVIKEDTKLVIVDKHVDTQSSECKCYTHK